MFSLPLHSDVVERPAGACVGGERRRHEMCVDVDGHRSGRRTAYSGLLLMNCAAFNSSVRLTPSE